MTQMEIRRLVEARFQKMGAKKIKLDSGECWTLNGEFFKVTTLNPFWVIEWTDRQEYADGGAFEDVDPMPYEITLEEIHQAVDALLSHP